MVRYRVRFQGHGTRVFGDLGLAFVRKGQEKFLTEREFQNLEVQKALSEGVLHYLGQTQAREPLMVPRVESPIESEDSVRLSKKDWAEFRAIMLECTSRLAQEINTTLQGSLHSLQALQGFQEAVPQSGENLPRKRTPPREEEDFVVTPDLRGTEAEIATDERVESGGDLQDGLEALRSLRNRKGTKHGR